MYLNTLQPAPGSRRKAKRLGRGIGSGKGKTCARGHKGQKARAGGYHKVGFEGGQMPLQRRIPKSGFKSPRALHRVEIYLSDLEKLTETVIDQNVLAQAGLLPSRTKEIKVIASGKLTRAITIKGIALTDGAKNAVFAANGTVEE